MSNKSEWEALGRLAKGLATGDMGKVAEVLSERPGEGPTRPEPKGGDPPCGRTCDGLPCIGHAPGGVCLFGTPSLDKGSDTEPAPKE